ncbi:sensor histidine kinase [Alteromonas stellipolaris]|uniref:sensor histidine kinase n=1 Tax=Alteromonas stellipolaris TaxID=233316 RepID=UPI0024949A70|nr:ATP-binding protein [Alteromonas stellipolaris]
MFGGLFIFFYVNASNFASLAVEKSFEALTYDIEKALYVDPNGSIKVESADMMLKWGFDALFSNISYRVVLVESNEVSLVSAPKAEGGVLINTIPLSIPVGYSKSNAGEVSIFREVIRLSNQNYYLDLARSDRLGRLVEEAVIPTIVDVSLFAVVVSFILFLTANFVATRLIVKSVKQLSTNVEKIRTDDLSARIKIDKVPSELAPVVVAFNHALDRVEMGFNEQKRFVADAAHELRTPLSILLTRIELYLRDNSIKQKLYSDTQYISRIVEQLLDLSRAQNLSENKIQEVDLVAISKDICGMLAPLALDHHQDLEIKADCKTSLVHADEGELAVIIKNLVENAIMHSSNDAKIRVSISNKYLSVEDSGHGIPKELSSKIFDRFYRIDQSNLTGSGLGLAITRELVSHLDAKLTVDTSQDLGGAHFKLIFN